MRPWYHGVSERPILTHTFRDRRWKLLVVTISYAAGNAGGIFGPSLFIGAMPGGGLGTFAHRFFPAYTATPGAYVLVGMGAGLAGIVRAPMTSVLKIFEMTQDYAVIVPLMIANLVSLFIASRWQRKPIYEELASQGGIHLPAAESRHRHVHPDQGLNLALKRMGANRIEIMPVVSRADVHQLLGVVSLHDVLESYGVNRES